MVTDFTKLTLISNASGDDEVDEFGEELDLDLDEELDSDGFEEEDLAE